MFDLLHHDQTKAIGNLEEIIEFLTFQFRDTQYDMDSNVGYVRGYEELEDNPAMLECLKARDHELALLEHMYAEIIDLVQDYKDMVKVRADKTAKALNDTKFLRY